LDKKIRLIWWVNLVTIMLTAVILLFYKLIDNIVGYSPVYIYLNLVAPFIWLSSCFVFYKLFIKSKDKFAMLPIVFLPALFALFNYFYSFYIIIALIIISQTFTAFKIFKKNDNQNIHS